MYGKLARGVHGPFPFLTPDGEMFAVAIAAPRAGEVRGREVARRTFRTDAERDDVAAELWAALNAADPLPQLRAVS